MATTEEQPFARGFRLQMADGRTLDGAQFPSGRCVVDDPDVGLITATTEVVIRTEEARVEWAKEANS